MLNIAFRTISTYHVLCGQCSASNVRMAIHRDWQGMGTLADNQSSLKAGDIMTGMLRATIETTYPFHVDTVELLRDVIGSIYKVETPGGTYCLKLYRPHQTKEARRSILLIEHLSKRGVHVPKIIRSTAGSLHFEHEGRTGILMEFIDGEVVDVDTHQTLALDEHRRMIEALEDYPQALPARRFHYYAGRYLDFMETIGFPEDKIETLRTLTVELFSYILKLPRGFSHGDYHNGNMILRDGSLFILDFDACNSLSPDVDLVTFLDRTDFNAFKASDMDRTIEVMRSVGDFTDERLASLLAYIPVRHMEIIQNINEAKGKLDSDHAFYLQQYQWIKEYHSHWARRFLKN